MKSWHYHPAAQFGTTSTHHRQRDEATKISLVRYVPSSNVMGKNLNCINAVDTGLNVLVSQMDSDFESTSRLKKKEGPRMSHHGDGHQSLMNHNPSP
jgi:hypothetical protein